MSTIRNSQTHQNRVKGMCPAGLSSKGNPVASVVVSIELSEIIEALERAAESRPIETIPVADLDRLERVVCMLTARRIKAGLPFTADLLAAMDGSGRGA